MSTGNEATWPDSPGFLYTSEEVNKDGCVVRTDFNLGKAGHGFHESLVVFENDDECISRRGWA